VLSVGRQRMLGGGLSTEGGGVLLGVIWKMLQNIGLNQAEGLAPRSGYRSGGGYAPRSCAPPCLTQGSTRPYPIARTYPTYRTTHYPVAGSTCLYALCPTPYATLRPTLRPIQFSTFIYFTPATLTPTVCLVHNGHMEDYSMAYRFLRLLDKAIGRVLHGKPIRYINGYPVYR